MWRVHRLDRISAKKPAKLLDSKSLTLGFSRKQIWPVFLPYSWIGPERGSVWSGVGNDIWRHRTLASWVRGRPFEVQARLPLSYGKPAPGATQPAYFGRGRLSRSSFSAHLSRVLITACRLIFRRAARSSSSRNMP